MKIQFKNQKELLTVASIIFAEARISRNESEDIEGIKAIISVGLNRLDRRDYFKCNSLYEVFTKPKQFSAYPASNQYLKAISGGITDSRELYRYRAILSLLYDDELSLRIIKSDHYFNPDIVFPDWAYGKKIDAEIGGHRFLTL